MCARTAAGAKAARGLSVLSRRRCFVAPPCSCSSTFITTELSDTLLMLHREMYEAKVSPVWMLLRTERASGGRRQTRDAASVACAPKLQREGEGAAESNHVLHVGLCPEHLLRLAARLHAEIERRLIEPHHYGD